ncbi:MAG TPA: prenyltransferase/squalene oxidase repeat-containing protein [Solirubrobacterales bacterium]|jgi:energy-coupling factor transport system substrate-specific component
MSWQLVSFLILAAVLLGGFAWYERSRPPAQVVALVAALAALAIAGRIAFAAFPNVKPTTDIVIFAGYALGPAAGFAVGALSALISNFWFGQGPWTPWQMAAWGLCGILGAALALGTRNVGRLTLAAVCGLAALGYGAILNFSLMASYGIEPSWAYFWVLEGRAVPFEAAHAIGNVAFALVAGPAMIRMLIRFRERFEWRRAEVATIAPPGEAPPRAGIAGTGRLAALLLAVLLVGAFASARAEAATSAGGPEAAVAWLRSAQNEDGGFGEGSGTKSSQEMTGWAMLGLEAGGANPQDVVSVAGKSPVDYLQAVVSTVQSPGDLARTILALEGAGVEPREFGGRNLVAALLAKRRQDGSYEGWPNSTAYAVLALRSAGIANVADSVEWLREVQNEDGGWGDVAGSPSTADGTGAVLQVLSPSSQAANRAVNYLRQEQQKGGGWRLGGNGALNTQSTAWAIQGLLAAGGNPADFKRGGKSAYEYLEGNQAGDGHYRYSSKSDQTPVWVTGEVLVAAAQKHLPLEAPPRAPQPKVTPTPSPSPTTEAPLPLPLPEEGGVAASPTPVFPAESSSAGPSPHRGKGGGKKNKGRQRMKGAPGAESGGTPGATSIPPTEVPVEPTPVEEGTGESFVTGAPADNSDSGSGSSVLGSIIAGLLAGGLLFAIGFGPFRRWQASRARRPGPTPPAAPPQGGPAPATNPTVPQALAARPPAIYGPGPSGPVATAPPASPHPPAINGPGQWPPGAQPPSP